MVNAIIEDEENEYANKTYNFLEKLFRATKLLS